MSPSRHLTINLYSNQCERVTGNPLLGFTHFHLQRQSSRTPHPHHHRDHLCTQLILQNRENEMEHQGGFIPSVYVCRRQYVFWRGCQKAGCLKSAGFQARCPSVALPWKATSSVVVTARPKKGTAMGEEKEIPFTVNFTQAYILNVVIWTHAVLRILHSSPYLPHPPCWWTEKQLQGEKLLK